VLEPEAAALIQALPYPRHSLRFDTVGFAVPIWPGTRPHQVLPFQWTCDVQGADGQRLQHSFLADAQGGDPRRAFASTLLQVLGDSGAVLAYNAGFERNRIRDLARQFDDLAPALEALLPRIVDLFQFAQAHYYHPVMAGSWSFKSISRAVAPDVALSMEGTDGAGEPTAQTIFARSLQRGLEEVYASNCAPPCKPTASARLRCCAAWRHCWREKKQAVMPFSMRLHSLQNPMAQTLQIAT